MKRRNQHDHEAATPSVPKATTDVIQSIRRGNAALHDEELERLREAARQFQAQRRSRRRAQARDARKHAGPTTVRGRHPSGRSTRES